MGSDVSMAFTLLLTGMITVFAVLLLVYITGKLLIRFVNAFMPDAGTLKTGDEIDKKKVAVINAAVEVFTGGAGRVVKIERKK